MQTKTRLNQKRLPHWLSQLMQLFRDPPRKKTFAEEWDAGKQASGGKSNCRMCLVEYTIPAAGHDRVFESAIELTWTEAQSILDASKAPSIFYSGYHSPEHTKIARNLEEKLNAAYPQFRHPVGIILSIKTKSDQLEN